MPNIIKLLPENVINKIAAGEVIERPYSVVKELVENSIDANANIIDVYTENGGKSLLKIVDNGLGMSREDALMAFERHATSKIKNADELFSLDTKGFRGEALSSIASISKVTIVTKTVDAQIGFKINISGGNVLSTEKISSTCGTTIEVRNLFYNTPVRKKFLKSDNIEDFKIRSWLLKSFITYPELKLRLFQDGKETVSLAKREDIYKRADDVYTIKDYTDFSFEKDGIQILGRTYHPYNNFSTNDSFSIFVNKRLVVERQLLKAVKDGYNSSIKDYAFPSGFINITINPIEVDINVHPQKLEVRFANLQRVLSAITLALQNGLKKFNSPVTISIPSNISNQNLIIENEKFEKKYPILNRNFTDENNNDNDQVNEVSVNQVEEKNNLSYEQNKLSLNLISGAEKNNKANTSSNFPSYKAHPYKAGTELKKSEAYNLFLPHSQPKKNLNNNFSFKDLKFIGQIYKCYLLCESNGKFYIIDMHAAHERVNYYKIRKKLTESKVYSQKLITPLIFDVSGVDTFLIEACLEISGFEIKIFKNEIHVYAVPTFLKSSDYAESIHLIIESILNEDINNNIEKRLDKIASLLACHSSIRSGEVLNKESVYSLFDALDDTESSGLCPHGRPVSIVIEEKEIEKWFGR